MTDPIRSAAEPPEPAGNAGSAERPEPVESDARGYRDPALLAGSPRGTYGHVAVLVAAGGADFTAFLQVMQLVMPSQSLFEVLLVVFGFTVTALSLAHLAGGRLREAAARPGPGPSSAVHVRAAAWWARRSPAHLCVLVWLALGLIAFWIRL